MKYSEIVKVKGRSFRYNYDNALLEWVSLTNIDIDEDDNLIYIELDEPQVVDCIGLSRENWEESPLYWCERYYHDIEEELKYLI